MPSNVSDSIKDTAGQIFNKLDQINFVQIAIIVGMGWGLLLLVEHLFPWIAKRLPAGRRMYLLPSIPVLRLAILIIAFVMIVPMVVRRYMRLPAGRRLAI